MKWQLKEPEEGDMIRVKFGDLYHYGIYVSDDEVIQFGLAPIARTGLEDSEVEVLTSDIDSFLVGGFLEVAEFDRKEKRRNNSPKEIVRLARARLGEKGYSILYNNCEHFAYECVRGEHYSSQAENVRAIFRSLPLVDVYIAPMPECEKIGPVLPPERDAEIKSVNSERLKKEKYFVWRLLEYALDRSLGLKIKNMTFKKSEEGKWTAGGCYFSLSHSEGALAVVISRSPVGIDIEKIKPTKSDRFAEKILTEKEAKEYEALVGEERLKRVITLWTAKEALYKSKGTGAFKPSEAETVGAQVRSGYVKINGDDFVYSVSTLYTDKIKIMPPVAEEKLLP